MEQSPMVYGPQIRELDAPKKIKKDRQPEHGKKIAPNKVDILEWYYGEDKYPIYSEIVDIAGEIEESIERVRTWFTNRRARDKKNPSH